MMPELPEVESVKNGLNKIVKGKTIQSVDVYWPRIINFTKGPKAFSDQLSGQTIQTVERRGKFLLFYLDRDVMISHLRMEGKYLFENQPDPSLHTHVLFNFTDQTYLHYNDVRKFGRMSLVVKEDVFSHKSLKNLGPEPIKDQLNNQDMQAFLRNKTKAIKTILLDQQMVVGIGNIYADEILFDAKILPTRPGQSLSAQEIMNLHESTIQIMNRAIQAGGSTIRSYQNAFGENGTYQDYHQVYGKKDEACPKCKKKIEKIQLNGRGTHFCPSCQR